MPLILSLETATKTCSVALHQDATLLALQEVHLEKSHAALLHLMIQNLLETCQVSRTALDAVAVSMGPGSYTGLRIGVSVAKGLCFALDISLIAVGTLEAMAWQVNRYNTQQALLCPMIDARRMEVYCLVQQADSSLLMPATAVVVEENTFEKYQQQGAFWIFGDGAEKCAPLISQAGQTHWIPGIYPSAKAIGALAAQKFEQKAFEDLAYFVPLYGKEFYTTKPKTKS